jgi:hypothetical protein
MEKEQTQNNLPLADQLERPNASRLLSEPRRERRQALAALDPGKKMKAAYALSIETRKLLIAGLQDQGFSKLEIHAILRARSFHGQGG